MSGISPDFDYCSNCEEEPASGKSYPQHSGDEPWCDSWKRWHVGKRRECDHFLCYACHQKQENAEPDMDRALGDYYGASTPQTEAERYAVAATEKEKLG